MHCLACNNSGLRAVLDLGQQPLANHLLENKDDPFAVHPLGLMCCPRCGHGQLSHFVSPEELFRHYFYASGTSGSLGAYFEWFCAEAAKVFAPGSDILEIACNDGSLLARFKPYGFNLTGVDPAGNLVGVARARGLEVIGDFWPCPDAIGSRKFDLIVGMNVLAHTPDPCAFLAGVGKALKDDGLCVIQTSQANMLVNGEFDTVYHEHFSFFTPGSMATLAARAGLVLRAVNRVDIHGVSFAFVLSRPGCRRDVSGFLAAGPYGVEHGLVPGPLDGRITGSLEQYDEFGRTARERMAKVVDLVGKHRAAGRKICFVGAAAKATTFLHAAKIKPDRVYDEAPLKIGRYIPGLGLPIEPLAGIAAIGEPLIVISAWNFRKELAFKVKGILPGKSCPFLVYFPEVEEFR